MEITTGTPNDVSDKNPEEKKSKFLLSFRSTSQVLKLKHVIALVKVEIRQTIVRFIDRKHFKKALIDRKGLLNINQPSLGLSSSDYIFMNENLTPVNNKVAFHCRKLKRNGQIDKTYSKDVVIHIASSK